MPYNGSGVFTRIYSWVNDAAAAIKIRADRMDAEFDGISTGLTNCITKDGQTTITANLPMAGFRHTGVGDGVSATDYASLGQVTTAIAAVTLNALSDVVITAAASGDFIYYNGTNFVNVAKNIVPIDGIKTTGASGVILKNSAGTTVATFGASAGTVSALAGNVTVGGTLAVTSTLSVTGKTNTAASASGGAGLNLPHGAAPSSPTNGDVWTTTLGVYSRVSGATIKLAEEIKTFHVQDTKSSGTNGGTFTSGAWRTRELNNSVVNTISGASLVGDQITLPAGTYIINGAVPAASVDNHQAVLYNVTDGSDAIIGSSCLAHSTTASSISSLINGVITIAGAKSFEVRHRCQTTRASDGFGKAGSFGNEVYTNLVIQKIG